LLNRALLVVEQKEIVTGEAEDKIEVPVAAHYSVAILPVVFSPGLQASSKDIFSIKKTRSEKSFNLTHSNNVMLIQTPNSRTTVLLQTLPLATRMIWPSTLPRTATSSKKKTTSQRAQRTLKVRLIERAKSSSFSKVRNWHLMVYLCICRHFCSL
jgi:hypothetical protein